MIEKKRIYILFVFVSLFFSEKVNAEELTSKSAKQYYLDGIYEYCDKNYATSAEQFEALSKNYPYSKYTHDSLIMEAYTNYINGEYDKIDGIVNVFDRLFPNDKYSDYMLYILAMSYYIRVKNETKGLNDVITSKLLFTKLIDVYPKSKYTEDAQIKINYLNKVQQLNEINIGDNYQKNESYISAMRRYVGIFEIYKDILLPEIEQIALCRIINLSKAMKLNDNALKYEKILNKKFDSINCF